MNKELEQTTLEYVTTTSELISDLQEKVASLESEKATLQRVVANNAKGTEKVASETKPVFSEDAVRATVGNLVTAGFLKESEETQAIVKLMAKPSRALAFLDKLAERETGADWKPIGVVEKTASDKGNDKAASRQSDRIFEERFTKYSK